MCTVNWAGQIVDINGPMNTVFGTGDAAGGNQTVGPAAVASGAALVGQIAGPAALGATELSTDLFSMGLEGAATVPELNTTVTVANNLLSRPYLDSQLLVSEIMSTGESILDPGGAPGAIRYVVDGVMNGSQGAYELVIQPLTNTILHFLFTSY